MTQQQHPKRQNHPFDGSTETAVYDIVNESSTYNNNNAKRDHHHHDKRRRRRFRTVVAVVLLILLCAFALFAIAVISRYQSYYKQWVSLVPSGVNFMALSSSATVDWQQAHADTQVNTNRRNIQYHTGNFSLGDNGLSSQEEEIQDRCEELKGFWFLDEDDNPPTSINASTRACEGPLRNNYTCCFCHILRDFEQLYHSSNYLYWSCAVARTNRILPYNETPMNAGGKRVAFMTGKFCHNSTNCTQEVNKYCQYVQELNVFDPKQVFCYSDSPNFVLQNPKFHRHLQYRTDPKDLSTKGGGFWFHKSVLLRHHMDQLEDGDFLVYTDVDRHDFIALGTCQTVVETLAWSRRNDDLSVEFIGNTWEWEYTKQDVLAAFNASKAIRESPQVLANAIVFRNSPLMRRFVDAWIDCVADWHMVSDEESILPNAKEFAEHRHDQSILSLLIKAYMTVQAVVGPPARPYHHKSYIVTNQFVRRGLQQNSNSDDEEDLYPTCPFTSSFYESLLPFRAINSTVI